jgi:excisionase family DNA binding protein
MTDGWMTVTEIAEHCGVNRRTIELWVKNHGMPSVLLPSDGNGERRRRRFDRAKVDAWLEENGRPKRRRRK